MPYLNIRSLRLQKGLREADVAGALGMSRSAYSRLECGQTRMDLDRLVGIAKVLGVAPWELLLPNGGPSAADDLLGQVVRGTAGRLPEEVLVRLVRLHAAQQAELRLLRERHARTARRVARLLGL